MELHLRTKSKTPTKGAGTDFGRTGASVTCGHARVYMAERNRDSLYMVPAYGFGIFNMAHPALVPVYMVEARNDHVDP